MTIRSIFLSYVSRSSLLHAAASAALVLPLIAVSTHAAAQTAPKPAGDVLTFTNGDQLTGKVVSETGGVVTFQSDMNGKITVPWSKIKELHSTEKFAVITKDQKLRVGRPAPQVPVGTVTFSSDAVSVSEAGGEAKNISAKDAAYVLSDGEFEKAMQHEPSLLQDWHGAATFGASLVESTQTSKTFTGSIGLVRSAPGREWLAPKNKTIFDASVAYGSVTQPAIGTTPASSAKTNIIHGDLERDWFLSSRFYALADASADHNLGSGLKLEQMYGAGAGYAVLRQPAQTLDVKGDVHFARQDFYSAGAGIADVSLNLVGVSAGEVYMRKLPRGMVFNESALVQPAINHPSAFTAQFVAGLLFPAYKNFGFSLGTQDNYINNPPAGYKNNTFLLTAGLNYTFK